MTGTTRDSGFFFWLARNARECPDRTAIRSLDQNVEITHGELFRLANRIGHFYVANGIGRGDRVVLLSNNSIEHLIVYLGSLAYGCTICTIHVEMNAAYLAEMLGSLGAKLILCEDGTPEIDLPVGKVSGQWKPLGRWGRDGVSGAFAEFADFGDTPGDWPVASRNDDASVFYTSGTATRPKGVLCTVAELHDNTLPIADAFGVTSDDRILDYRSMNWMSAQVLSALGPVAKGATLLLARRFSVSKFFDWVNGNQATIAAGNPTIINMLVNREADRGHGAAPSLRFLTSSSAPLLVSEWRRFETTFGIPVCQGYGASEVGWIAGSHEGIRKMGSVGKPLAYQKVRIVSDDGKPLAPGEIGAIQLNGNPAGRYRYVDSDGSIRVHAEGAALTGDLGYIDDDGFLFVTGREKDLIIRGGVNISPLEIDNVILQMPDIADVATVGVPDPTYGEKVVTYFVPAADARVEPDAVMAHCVQHLADFKVPGEIILRDALPRTARGKMDRRALAEAWKVLQGAD